MPTGMRAVKKQSSTIMRDIRQEAEEEAMSAKAGAPSTSSIDVPFRLHQNKSLCKQNQSPSTHATVPSAAPSSQHGVLPPVSCIGTERPLGTRVGAATNSLHGSPQTCSQFSAHAHLPRARRPAAPRFHVPTVRPSGHHREAGLPFRRVAPPPRARPRHPR